MSADSPGRETAYRLFAAEFDDATLTHRESDEERAPNYVVSPTGARINRLFAVGTLTEVTEVSEEMVRARVVDPTGAFVVYAGQYQPDQLSRLEQLDPPLFVAVTGKARTFEPEDSDQVYTSVRPESIAVVDAETRDRWVVDAARFTHERIGAYAAAAASDGETDTLDVDPGLAAGINLAHDHYGTTPAYLTELRNLATEAVEVVVDEREQVSGLHRSPGEPGDVTATYASLASVDVTDADGEDRSRPTDEQDETDDTERAAPDATAEQAESADGPPVEDPLGEPASAERTASSGGAPSEPDETDPSRATPAPETAPEQSESPVDETSAVDTEAGSTDPAAETSTETAEQSPGAETPAQGELDAEPEEAGLYEMDDEERAELESEFTTDFTPGTEVEEPEDPAGGEPTPPEEDSPVDEQADEGDDLVDAVVATMERLDDGTGAARAAVVDSVAEDTGASPDEIDAAIQDALMDGRCYEPAEDTLKAI